MTWSFRLNFSLRTRLALTMVAVVAALGLSIRLFIEKRLVDDMEQELESRAVTIATNLAAESVEPILYQDWVSLERLLRTSQQVWGDFEYAFVLVPKRRVLAHTLIGDIPDDLRRFNRFEFGLEPQIQRTRTLGFYHRDVAVPIYGGQLGVLHLGFRDKSIIERLDNLSRDVVALLAMVAAVSALVVLGITHFALRPLTSIVQGLEAFQPGRIRREIPIHRRDEIGDVAQKVNDITLRLHKAQIELDNENRLAAVGRLASVIAHEVGNPLASIMTRLELMGRSQEEQFLRESLPLLRGQLGRIQKLTSGLSHISRSRRIKPCDCDANDVVREVVEMLRFDPRASKIRVELVLMEMPLVRCVRDQLFQVLVNLGLNGLRAAGPGRSLLFKTRPEESVGVVEIVDDGPGVPIELRDKIFEPFFSTEAGGAGLGLTISRDLMRQQGGDLRLFQNEGRGACFRVGLAYTKGSDAGDEGL